MPGPIDGLSSGLPPLAETRTARRPTADPTPRAAQLKQACQDFESLFLNQMMQQMRRTVPEDGLFSGGKAESLYTSMMDSEVARSVARQGGLGLAAVLYQQLVAQGALDE